MQRLTDENSLELVEKKLAEFPEETVKKEPAMDKTEVLEKKQ